MKPETIFRTAIIIGLFLIAAGLVIPSSLGAMLDNNKAWYTNDGSAYTDNDADTTIYNLTTTGTHGSVSGIVGNGMDSQSDNNDNLYVPGQVWVSSGSLTMGCWYDPDDTSSHYMLLSQAIGTGPNWGMRVNNNGYLEIPDFSGLSTAITQTDVQMSGAGGWYHAVWVHNVTGPVNKLYINGVELSLDAGATATIDNYGDNAVMGGYAFNDAADNYEPNGILDECAVWNRALTDAEVLDLYNGGSGRTLSDYAAGPAANFTVSVTAPTGFNVTTDGNVTYETASGTVTTGLLADDPSLHDIVISAKTYFSAEYDSYNVSSNIVGVTLLHQPLIQVYDRWTGLPITGSISFNIFTGGGAYDTVGPTHNKDRYIGYNNSDVNVSANYGTWLHTTEYGINLSPGGFLNTTVYQAKVNVTSYEKATGNIIQNWTIWYQGANYSTTTGSLFLYPNVGNYSFNWSSPEGYINITVWVNVSTGGIQTANLTGFYDTNVTVGAYNAFSGESLANISGWAYHNGTGYNESFSTAAAPVYLGLIPGIWYFYAESPGYSVSGANYRSVNITAPSHLVNFSFYSQNSVLVYIRNEDTGSLITDNITVTFTGNASETTYYTATGSLLVENLTDGAYTVKFQGGNWTLKTYSLTVADRSFQTLNAYLSATSETVTFTFLDYDSAGTLTGVSLTVYRLINSTWTVVDAKTSDISGRAQVQYTPLVKYRFDAVLTGYTTSIFYLDPVIFDSYTVRLQKVTTLEDDIDYLGVSVSYYPTLFYANQENTFTWFIESPGGYLESYNLTLVYPGGSSFQSGTSAIGEQFVHAFNISGAASSSRVNISYCYDITIGSGRCFFYGYGIIGAYGNESFLANQDNTYGLGLFDRVLITTLIVLVVTGFLTFIAGVLAGAPVGLLLFGYLSYIGFIPLWAILPSLLVGIIVIAWRSST